MNLMYGIGAITPLIVLNSLFLILVITVFRAVITVSSATLVHCLLWIVVIITCNMLADFYDILSTLLSVIISIAFCIVLFLEGGGGCCLLFCLLLELWYGVSFIFIFYRYISFIFKKNTFHHIALILTLISCQTYKVWFYSVSPSL